MVSSPEGGREQHTPCSVVARGKQSVRELGTELDAKCIQGKGQEGMSIQNSDAILKVRDFL